MTALYYGDNLQVLREKIATERVDLIYLDPPGLVVGDTSHYNYSVCGLVVLEVMWWT